MAHVAIRRNGKRLEAMARLRPPHNLSTAPTTEVVPRPRSPHLFKKGHERLGGRERGQPNHISRSTREAILLGLEIAGNTMGRQGIVSYVVAAARKDFKHGIALLSMVTPRSADLHVTHAPAPVTLEELDEQLRKLNLPPMRELYSPDFHGDSVEDATEAEVVAEEGAAQK
jgi:hypothetical protein